MRTAILNTLLLSSFWLLQSGCEYTDFEANEFGDEELVDAGSADDIDEDGYLVGNSAPVGFASEHGGTTGGRGGKTVTVRNKAAFLDAIGDSKRLTIRVKRKISLFTNVEQEAVITAVDVESIYEVPIRFHEEGLDRIVCDLLDLEMREPDLAPWRHVVDTCKEPSGRVTPTATPRAFTSTRVSSTTACSAPARAGSKVGPGGRSTPGASAGRASGDGATQASSASA